MLEFELFWKAFIASALVGTILPLVGTFALLKRSTFLGAGMAHTAFAGVAFGILLGLNPIITALITTAIASTFIWHWTRKGRISHDTGIGIFFSVSMALAVLFFSLSKSQTDALGFLFGNVLSVTGSDLNILVIISLVVIGFIVLFWKELFFITLSEELALASGIPVEPISFAMLLAMSFAIVVSLRAVGTLLVFGLLVIPSAASYQLTSRLASMVRLAVAIGVVSAIGGLTISIFFNLPAGPVAVLLSFIALLIALAVPKREVE